MCTTGEKNDGDADDEDTRSINAKSAKFSSSVLATAMVRVVGKSGEKFFLRAMDYVRWSMCSKCVHFGAGCAAVEIGQRKCISFNRWRR